VASRPTTHNASLNRKSAWPLAQLACTKLAVAGALFRMPILRPCTWTKTRAQPWSARWAVTIAFMLRPPWLPTSFACALFLARLREYPKFSPPKNCRKPRTGNNEISTKKQRRSIVRIKGACICHWKEECNEANDAYFEIEFGIVCMSGNVFGLGSGRSRRQPV